MVMFEEELDVMYEVVVDVVVVENVGIGGQGVVNVVKLPITTVVWPGCENCDVKHGVVVVMYAFVAAVVLGQKSSSI